MLDRYLPVIQAPMAGGPSTPQLVAAVSGAGGLGFLAGGYLSPAALLTAIAETQELTNEPFGVNLFVPGAPATSAEAAAQRAAVDSYRRCLAPHAAALDADLPDAEELPWDDEDHYVAKIEALSRLEAPPAVVSLTFGLPQPAQLALLHERGIATVVTVTNEAEARAAVDLGVSGLCVQGPEAGGHRGTHDVKTAPDSRNLSTLLAAITAELGQERGRIHLTASGGVDSPQRVQELLKAGADSVQAGTAYLRAPEAGTHPTHRAALATGSAETVVTRAFTGRAARAVSNLLARELAASAPPVYPAVHHLTRPLRAAAAARGDAQRLHLWAGVNYRAALPAPAAAMTAWLGGDVTEIAPFITGE
ncbi:NAD(P)H-dependent flavin oxidoreductase [Zhihengliuella flava]|uniref:Propionate 3-nitronate monooxygenase n=1 Tax=Zhihengliuella flava TaxID=1285193 RepID=A0A931DF98_9MICC|nr:nitronate monooxygenase [Zhihengliuella flava]MBG6085703.1 nitronate monooxygenase [Zhihengliuella flava]